MAYLDLDQGNHAAAETGFRRLVEQEPPDPNAVSGLALTLHRAGKKAEAREWFGKYLQMAPRGSRADRARQLLAGQP
jgi:Flp pilus assembly protein TadD